MTMEITITCATYTPRWDTLEKVIQEVTNDEDRVGRIVQIIRSDGGVDYRGPGHYTVGFRTPADDMLMVSLTVKGN